MKENEIEIGKAVMYYPVKGIESMAKETIITSDAYKMWGTTVCRIGGVIGAVDIDNLKAIK